jgi:hypothetical protein
MLKGTFIQLEPGHYGFENISHSMTCPEQTRLIWRVINVGHRIGNLRYAIVDEAIGKEANLHEGRVSVYCGHGAYIQGELEGGANAMAAVVSVTTIPKPKVRGIVEVRWHHDGYHGFWQKYLKRTGWVRA